MFGRSVPRLAAALALAAVLVTALPVAAIGPRGPARRGSESWIESLATLVGQAWGRLTAVWAEEGLEGDPNGKAAPACDGGIEGDPNGCPALPKGDGGIEGDPNG